MKYLLILFFIISFFIPVFSSEIEDMEKKTINEAIDLMYNEKFEEAEGILKYIKDTYPDHPIGDFFLGFYYNFLASFYETDKFDSKIALYYSLAEKKARFHLLHDEKNPWYNFYIGACLVNKGYLLGRDGSMFSGLKKTYDGISYIEDCLEKDPEFGDALMLMGSYKYYKSSITHWIYDRRDVAAYMVKKSIDSSYYSKFLAISTLGWIYIDYKKFELAEEASDLALKQYPESHLFLFLKARALFEQKKYYESTMLYHRIEEKLNNMGTSYSNKDIFNVYYFLSKGYLGQNNYQMCEKYLILATDCSLTEKERDILEDRIEDIEDMASDLKEKSFIKD